MPDPKKLRVGDRVRFIASPRAWELPESHVPEESVALMKLLVSRRSSSRVHRVDAEGWPWIEVRVRSKEGQMIWHDWSISEHDGWVRVNSRRGAQ